MNMQTLHWPSEDVAFAIPYLRLISLVDLTDEDRMAWDRLAEQAEPGFFFAHPWFLEPLLDVPGRVLAVIENASGHWEGLVALDRVERLGRLPVPLWHCVKDANQFLGSVLIRKGQALSFWTSMISALENVDGTCLGLLLPELPQDSEAALALRAYASRTQRRLEVIRSGQRAALHGGVNYDDHLAKALPAKRRGRLASLARKIEAEVGPLRLEQAQGPLATSHWIDQFLALERVGWKGDASSAMAASSTTEHLFRSAVSGAADKGIAQCLTLFAGPVPLAFSVQFIDGPTGCGFKTCYDERYARFAPGLQLLLQITRQICGTPGLRFDSCSTPDQASINGLWPDRIKIADYCIGFHGRGRGQMFDAVMAVRKLWHQGKALV